jgi:hypothetical protein
LACMTACLGAVVVVALITGRQEDIIVVFVWATDLGGEEVNGCWYAGGGGLACMTACLGAVVALMTGRVDVVVVIVWATDPGGDGLAVVVLTTGRGDIIVVVVCGVVLAVLGR